MTHEIEGLVLKQGSRVREIDSLRTAVQRSLDQGLVFVPLTETVLEEVAGTAPTSTTDTFPEFRSMSIALEKLLIDASAAGPIAYVETEYWGGEGHQSAAVWVDRRLAYGPAKGDIGTINAALEILGATSDGTRDAFESVGLHRHRLTDDWAADG